MFFPFLWTIITSITPGAGLTQTPALIPEDPSLDAYAAAVQRAARSDA